MQLRQIWFIVASLAPQLLFTAQALAASPAKRAPARRAPASVPQSATPTKTAAAAKSEVDDPNKPGPQPLDGVNVEAVETYLNPKSQQLDFGLALLPLDPYYNGFSINVAYRRHFGERYAWRVVNLNYVYGVNTDLTSQLAQRYGVQPKAIERLSFIISSDFEWTLAYGKLVLFRKYIRYFRAALAGGPAFATTNKRATVGVNAAVRLETFVNEDFSWSFELRDVYASSNIANNLVMTLGASYAF